MKRVAFGALIALVAITTECRAQAVGIASYYGYSRGGYVAAHRTLPIGSRVKVTNLGNGRTATLVVVGRGPFVGGRIIDVSTAAADALGFRREGIARVQIDPVRQ